MPHFGEYTPASWGWNHGAAAQIVPFRYAGHAFPGGVAAGTVPIWTEALDRLTTATGFSLPPALDDSAGCWGYEDRVIAGSASPSFHAYGLALDLAAPWNPSHTTPANSIHRMPVNTAILLRPLGIEWGGTWSARDLDWEHIELHLTPAEVAAMLVQLGHVGGSLPFPLPDGCYFGPYSGPASSISGSGRQDAQYRPALAAAQTRLGTIADGYYGQLTAAATIRWQRSHGLVADALIGPATWASLFATSR